MELTEKYENFGGGGGGTYGGVWLCLLIIFLIILYAMHRDNQRGGAGDLGALAAGAMATREGCADKLTWARYANYVDPELARNHHDQAVDTGKILKDMAVETGAIRCEIDKQTGGLLLNAEKNARDLENRMQTIAREQERYFYQAQLDDKNGKLAEQRERAVMLESRLIQEQSAREADRRQAELFTAMNNNFCIVNNRITGIEGRMLKAPDFFPLGGIQCVNQCGYVPCGNNGCGTYGA